MSPSQVTPPWFESPAFQSSIGGGLLYLGAGCNRFAIGCRRKDSQSFITMFIIPDLARMEASSIGGWTNLCLFILKALGNFGTVDGWRQEKVWSGRTGRKKQKTGSMIQPVVGIKKTVGDGKQKSLNNYKLVRIKKDI